MSNFNTYISNQMRFANYQQFNKTYAADSEPGTHNSIYKIRIGNKYAQNFNEQVTARISSIYLASMMTVQSCIDSLCKTLDHLAASACALQKNEAKNAGREALNLLVNALGLSAAGVTGLLRPQCGIYVAQKANKCPYNKSFETLKTFPEIGGQVMSPIRGVLGSVMSITKTITEFLSIPFLD
ncbi:MAG: hypothetical protein JHC93_08800, partial [Parachlamydiales bacterium]|nr:hypothetical protein [Parachlamydiales bacterium]